MANVISGVGYLPKEVVREMFNSVKGHSAIARLKSEDPIPFTGATAFVFGMDKEVDIVGENGAKSNGGGTATAVTINPVKFEYGMRVSDEFMKGSEEYQLDVTQRFIEGFGRKVAKGFDIAAMHGINPRTGAASVVVGDNNLDDKIPEANVVAYTEGAEDTNLDTATALVEGVNGMAIAPAFASAMAAIKVNGVPQYPEFRFGSNPETFYGMRSDVNSTVGTGGIDMAIVGDFDALRWGYAEDIELKVIEYGNPDNDADAGDLAGHNQVYLRCECYIGWGILDPAAFARIAVEDSSN